MKDFLEPLMQDRKKLYVAIGGVVAVVLVVIILIVVMSGGGEEEVEFEFDPIPAEPEVSVEEQVAQTVAAMVPTPTPEPTLDIPATLEAAAVATREAIEAENPLKNGRDVPAVDYALTPSDIRYLDALGKPVWLATQSYFELSFMFELLPGDYLVITNLPSVQSIASTMRRAEDLLENSVQYQPDVSAPVRNYGLFVEDLVLKIRDASVEASVMFSQMEFGEETYDDLSKNRREEFNDVHFRVGDLLEEFERDMERYGCSACGELFRGRR